jgi:hypothetical protein
MNNDDNIIGSINIEGYLRTRITVDDYEKNYKQKIQNYIAQDIERTRKIIEKYKLNWWGLDAYTRKLNDYDFMIQFEEEMDIQDINGVDVVGEDSEIAELINKIKQGKLRIKKSK